MSEAMLLKSSARCIKGQESVDFNFRGSLSRSFATHAA
jgi:hypothetical protein